MTQAAFPSPGVVIESYVEQRQQGAYEGMSLRDYFAAKVLQGMWASPIGTEWTNQQLAKEAYRMADTMMEARDA